MSDPAAPDPIEDLRSQLASANQRVIHAELKAHAIRAGIIDLDGLKMLDTTALKLEPDGTFPGGETALANLKRDKPWLFGKATTSHPAPAPAPEPAKTRMAKEMSYEEWQLARDRLIRGR